MQADKRKAPEALAADHRFQQEGVDAARLRLGQLQVQRQRRFQVGKGLGDQRDAVVALVGQRFEFQFGHVDPLLAAPAYRMWGAAPLVSAGEGWQRWQPAPGADRGAKDLHEGAQARTRPGVACGAFLS
ncbi:hypothetical protein D3C81_1612870 [compost metagenome]